MFFKMCMSILPACILFAVCVPGTHGRQKRASDTLEPELEMIVINRVGARNGTQVLQKNSQCCSPVSSQTSDGFNMQIRVVLEYLASGSFRTVESGLKVDYFLKRAFLLPVFVSPFCP